jgi:hypothetical protein
MKYLLVIVFIGLAFCTAAQQEIKLEEVRNHIGDSVKLRAKIYGAKYLETSANTPTFLDVGGHYPKAPLTLLIWEMHESSLPMHRKPFIPARSNGLPAG